MSHWSALIAAYEQDLQVLEEARRAYLNASRSLLEHLGSGLRSLDVPGEVGVAGETNDPDWSSVIGEAPRLRARYTRSEDLPAVVLGAWIASAWGGPVDSLRVGVALENLPHPLAVAEDRWLSAAQGSTPELPGEPYAVERHLDVPEGHWLSIHTLHLSAKDEPAILSEALATASALVRGGLQALDAMDREARPLLDTYAALRAQHPRLLESAATLGAVVAPNRLGNLLIWQGQDYLQIGRFWVGIDPRTRCVWATSDLPEVEVIRVLERSLRRQAEQRNRYPSLLLVSESELGTQIARDRIAARSTHGWSGSGDRDPRKRSSIRRDGAC